VFGLILSESKTDKLPLVSKQLITIYKKLRLICDWVLNADCSFPQFSYQNYGLHNLSFVLHATIRLLDPKWDIVTCLSFCVNVSLVLSLEIWIWHYFYHSKYISILMIYCIFIFAEFSLIWKLLCFGKRCLFLHPYGVWVDFVSRRKAWKK
jgi:hypothetical protein